MLRAGGESDLLQLLV